MLDRLRQFVRNAGTLGEENTDRDGFLSHSAETHAVGHGLFHGLTSRPWRARPATIPDNQDVQAEIHYFKGAYVVGTVLQWTGAVTAFVLGRAGYTVLPI